MVKIDGVVAKAYVGKPHTCGCGCAGKYRVRKQHATQAHDVTNDKWVDGVVNKMEEAEEMTELRVSREYISMIIDDKVYTAYFAK